MNIEDINEYHDTIVNTRKLLGDVHTGDASRAQASLAAFVTYATRIDDAILKKSIDKYKVIDEPHNSHAKTCMMIGGVSITSITFSNIIHDCKCLKERNVKNIWYVVKRNIPYITIGTFLIIASVLLERSEHES